MKVLWITNVPLGPLKKKIGIDNLTSGSWLDASYEAIKDKDIELTVVTHIGRALSVSEGKHKFYGLPGSNNNNINSKKNIATWEKIIKECKPEVVQLWGTEYKHGLLALRLLANVPSVVYMQGVMSQIARYSRAGLTFNELLRAITIRDILRFGWITRMERNNYKQAIIEAEIIHKSGNVIVENQWCAAHCKAINYNVKVFFSNLIIKNEFFEKEWSPQKMQPFSIISNSPGNPIKGLHILLRAMHIVVKHFPNTTLKIPGTSSPFKQTLFSKIKNNGYVKFIKNEIQKFKLVDKIQFLGRLSSAELADEMALSNVFVMPSSIENHSSTLIEALVVGIPCISSNVGGITDYLKHGVNGLLYRFEEHELLAIYIMKIFSDIDYAKALAENGKISARSTRKAIDVGDDFINIYKSISISR